MQAAQRTVYNHDQSKAVTAGIQKSLFLLIETNMSLGNISYTYTEP